MYKLTQTQPTAKITVAVLASYALVNKSLQSLIENCGRQVAVSALAASTEELIKKVSQYKPNVVLLCLMDNDKETIEIIPQLLQISPNTRVIILTSPNGLQSSTDALKKGAMGIVGMNQSANVLIRAIEQVSQGETWLSQKIFSKVLEKDSASADDDFSNSPKGEALTKRELEVISMIGLGMKNKEIAKELFISEATVRHHLSSIYSKLCVEDRLNLVIHAYKNGLVQVPDQIH